jgi:hypothetical protein
MADDSDRKGISLDICRRPKNATVDHDLFHWFCDPWNAARIILLFSSGQYMLCENAGYVLIFMIV